MMLNLNSHIESCDVTPTNMVKASMPWEVSTKGGGWVGVERLGKMGGAESKAGVGAEQTKVGGWK